MKKKLLLLYCLMGLVVALSLVGFTSCDDDDDDDTSTATAEYYDDEDEDGTDSVFSSVAVTHGSSGAVTKITAVIGDTTYKITGIISDTDDTSGTYYCGTLSLETDSSTWAVYIIYVQYNAGTWYYNWECVGTGLSRFIMATGSDSSIPGYTIYVYYTSEQYSSETYTAVTVSDTSTTCVYYSDDTITVDVSGTTYVLEIVFKTGYKYTVLLYCFCKSIGCITTVGEKHGEPPYRLKFTEDVKHEVVRLKD